MQVNKFIIIRKVIIKNKNPSDVDVMRCLISEKIDADIIVKVQQLKKPSLKMVGI